MAQKTPESHNTTIVTMPSPPKKPTLQPLKTTKSPAFPSEIHEKSPPVSGKLEALKHGDAQKTPITPPVAYTEFLRSLTPILTSPMSTGMSSLSGRNHALSTPASQPTTATSMNFSPFDAHRKSPGIPIPQASPFGRPRSARTPRSLRALRIPASPRQSAETPTTASTRSPFTPSDWAVDITSARPKSASERPVCVRHVMTRTVTYKRTPLDPAPKGKRRRTSE